MRRVQPKLPGPFVLMEARALVRDHEIDPLYGPDSRSGVLRVESVIRGLDLAGCEMLRIITYDKITGNPLQFDLGPDYLIMARQVQRPSPSSPKLNPTQLSDEIGYAVNRPGLSLAHFRSVHGTFTLEWIHRNMYSLRFRDSIRRFSDPASRSNIRTLIQFLLSDEHVPERFEGSSSPMVPHL